MTRTQLLTVGLIIGLVGALSGFAVVSAREKTRDVIRVAQVRELQIGLELFFSNHSAYPVAAEALALGQTTTACLSDSGFGVPCNEGDTLSAYVEFVPSPPAKGLKERSACGTVKNGYCYVSNGASYTVQFELERANSLLGVVKGLNCATENGVIAGACPVLAAE